MTEPFPTIQVTGLSKRYGSPQAGLLAVDRIDLEVRRGEVFGLLGPNGAGKTTTIRVLTGLARPSGGQATVLGLDLSRDLPHIKKRIGVVPEASNLYDELTAFDNLLFSMQLYGVPRRERVRRADELLERFRLVDKRDVPFARLSRGMKRALTIAAALAHHPEVLFLDEPTTGLDVVSARGLRQTVAGLREQGVTVFLTTHYLEEAERLCDRIALLVRGRIVALDTVDGLRAQVQGATAVEVTLDGGTGEAKTRRVAGEDIAEAARTALAWAEREGRRVLAINTIRPTLEDAFIGLTGLSADVMRAEKGGRGG
jgi:ABC-2 type transport system ATP-binding protein